MLLVNTEIIYVGRECLYNITIFNNIKMCIRDRNKCSIYRKNGYDKTNVEFTEKTGMKKQYVSLLAIILSVSGLDVYKRQFQFLHCFGRSSLYRVGNSNDSQQLVFTSKVNDAVTCLLYTS